MVFNKFKAATLISSAFLLVIFSAVLLSKKPFLVSKNNESSNLIASIDSTVNLRGSDTQYKNLLLNFSIFYPNNLKITETSKGNTSTIIFNDKKENRGFQVFVVPYLENEISEERLKMDLPSGIILEQKSITVDGVPATTFFSKNTKIGDTKEIWFIKNGFLYEIMTYKDLDNWLLEIMKTWKFI